MLPLIDVEALSTQAWVGTRMMAIRIHATAQTDGELHLRGLPIQKGQQAEVIVLTEQSTDDSLLTVLQHDPGWAWLSDSAEDLYTEADVR
jgi:hypothetical protein